MWGILQVSYEVTVTSRFYQGLLGVDNAIPESNVTNGTAVLSLVNESLVLRPYSANAVQITYIVATQGQVRSA